MNILAITGAGISASSGLPTYRGEDGLYTKIEKRSGARIEDLLSIDAFKKDPAKVWHHWRDLSLEIYKASPSPTHQALATLSRHYRIGKPANFSPSVMAPLRDFEAIAITKLKESGSNHFLEVTQNVDCLSKVAGVHRKDVVELHGNYHQHWCAHCRAESVLEIHPEMEIPPMCKICKSAVAIMRPRVTMFGEGLNPHAVTFCEEYARRAHMILIIGTSLQFHYLASLIKAAVNEFWRDPLLVYVDPHASPYKSTLLALDSDLKIENRLICIRKNSDEVIPKLVDFLVSKAPSREELEGWCKAEKS